MKESVLDVLLYLFENAMHDAPAASDDRDSLRATLLEAGFSETGVVRAFDWLEELGRERVLADPPAGTLPPVRIFAGPELQRLDRESRGFLLTLEANGVLTPAQRELVLDRVLALDHDALELDDLKWVVLMVLTHQSASAAARTWIEAHLFGAGDERVN